MSELDLQPIDWPDLDVDRDPPDDRGTRLLIRLLAEIETIDGLGDVVLSRSFHPSVRGLGQHGVPYRPRAWFGSTDVAERKAWSRATRRLERDGYVERIVERERNRVTHLVPTPAGLSWALAASPAADRRAVAAGLKRVEWGTHLVDALGDELGSRESR